MNHLLALLALVSSLSLAMPTLNATFIDGRGNARTGSVILRPLSTPQVDGARLIGSGDVTEPLDGTGSISVVLSPGRWRLVTAWDRPIELLLPNDEDEHDLADVAPLTPVGVSSSRVLYYGISTDEILDASGILALSSVSRSSLAGTFVFPTGEGFYYFALPDGFGSPAAGTGFMLGAFPVDMASGGAFTATENGWSYLPISVGGAAYRLYRTTSPQGDAQSINVQ